ncbi:hypothetical protein FPV67DRAFT_1447550 [Lyophyllum atratum]|nr:hypothetical protein FPV67DRAFT_1447550 [Lyophyllum atratum]
MSDDGRYHYKSFFCRNYALNRQYNPGWWMTEYEWMAFTPSNLPLIVEHLHHIPPHLPLDDGGGYRLPPDIVQKWELLKSVLLQAITAIRKLHHIPAILLFFTSSSSSRLDANMDRVTVIRDCDVKEKQAAASMAPNYKVVFWLHKLGVPVWYQWKDYHAHNPLLKVFAPPPYMPSITTYDSAMLPRSSTPVHDSFGAVLDGPSGWSEAPETMFTATDIDTGEIFPS